MKAKPLPDATILSHLLSYEASTGLLHWRNKPSKREKVGDVAGHLHKTGYVHVQIQGQRCLAQRVIWKMVTGRDPVGIIDHENRIKSDNRFDNLRDSSDSQNRANAVCSINNTSGYKGVSFKANRWEASIKVDHKSIYLGRFSTPQDAHNAYCQAAMKHFGEFARAA